MGAKFKPGKTVGIDLGTTRSSVAHVDEFGKAAVIPNAEAELVTPSVVLIDEGDLRIVGSEAKNQSVAAGSRVIRESKRDIGRTDAKWDIDGTVYTPEMIGSLILTKLKQDAETKLGVPVVNAAITVPAYFDDSQRAATEAAGELAGLNVVAILNEPVAAALAYGLDRDRSDGHVVVYDLGGGTFDVSVMKIEGGQITMVATDGNVELGGKDWDDRIIQHIAEKFRAEHGADPLEDVDAYQQLKNDAESAKESLSSKEKTRVIVQYGGAKMVHELTRDVFEELTADLLSQTENTLAEVVEEQAGLSWDDVSQVLLVGGSSKMPQVARMIRELTGKEVKVGDPEPDLCVALGAAAYGAILEAQAVDSDPDMDESQRNEIKERILALPPSRREKLTETRVTMVTSHAYGVEVIGENGQPYNDVLIEKNAALPASTTQRYGTYEDNQTSVEVNVWEGEQKDLSFCKKAGTGPISGFPPLPKGSPLEVTMTFTEQGIIEVHARELTHGRELNMRLERPQGMTEAEKRQASTQLAKMQVE